MYYYGPGYGYGYGYGYGPYYGPPPPPMVYGPVVYPRPIVIGPGLGMPLLRPPMMRHHHPHGCNVF